MPITPVNTTPVGLGYTIQRSSDTENGVDASFAGGMATADALRQKVKIQPYLEDAAVAQAKDAEGAANSRIALRPAEENLRNAEIRGAVYDHDINDQIASDVKRKLNEQRARLLNFEDTLWSKKAEAMTSAQEMETDDAATGAVVSGVRRTKAQQLATTLGNMIEAEKARSTVLMDQAAKLHKDPLGQAKFFAEQLMQYGIAADPYETSAEELGKMWSRKKQEEYAQLEKLATLGKKADLDPMKAETDLRKEFNALPDVSRFRLVTEAFEKVKASAGKPDPEAADDLATIFSFMRLLDPGSTVREGEFATAQNAAGIPERIRNIWNKALNGERLDPNQRKNMLDTSESLYNAQKKGFDRVRDQFAGLAQVYGVVPARVVGMDEPVKPTENEAPAAGGKPTAPAAPQGKPVDVLRGGVWVPAIEVRDPQTGVVSHYPDPNRAAAKPAPVAAPVAAPPVVENPATPAPAAPAPASGPVIRALPENSGSLFGGRWVPDASSPSGWKKVPWGETTTPSPE